MRDTVETESSIAEVWLAAARYGLLIVLLRATL